MTDKKIFDDFPTVTCDGCELYYLNQCDGVKTDSKRLCKAFIAVRGQSIPQEITLLKKANKRLKWSVVILAVIDLIILGLEVFT